MPSSTANTLRRQINNIRFLLSYIVYRFKMYGRTYVDHFYKNNTTIKGQGSCIQYVAKNKGLRLCFRSEGPVLNQFFASTSLSLFPWAFKCGPKLVPQLTHSDLLTLEIALS